MEDRPKIRCVFGYKFEDLVLMQVVHLFTPPNHIFSVYQSLQKIII